MKKLLSLSTIKAKILLVVLGISLASIVIFGLTAVYNMKTLGNYASRKSSELGGSSAADSEKELRKQAKYYLLRLAEDQAAISNTIFQKVETEVNFASWHAGELWKSAAPSPDSRYYTPADTPPADVYPSVVRIVSGVPAGPAKSDINRSSGLDSIFRVICSMDTNIKSIYLGTAAGVHRRYPWISQYKKDYDPRDRNWYKEAAAKASGGWTELYISASEEVLMVTCFNPVYNPKKKLAGVIGVDVTLQALNDRILNTQIGDLGYTFLLDKNGKIIASRQLTKQDQKWNESLKTTNLLSDTGSAIHGIALKMTRGETGIEECFYEGAARFIAFAPVKTTNWSIAIVMPVEEVIKSAEATRNKIISATGETGKHINYQISKTIVIILIVIIAIIILIIILSDRLSKMITDPVLALNEGAKIIGNGNLDYSLSIKTGDELEVLAGAFNKMTGDLKNYIKNLKETTAAKERIESELKIATEIQESFLPRIFPPFPDRNDFEIFATMQPAKEVGGDFYDFALINDEKLYFLIADVSGKGVPAALFMVIMKTLLKNEALQGEEPQQILHNVNDIIARDNDSCMFATVFCGVLDTRTGELAYANAGHNPPLLYKKDGSFEYIEMPKGFVLGPMPSISFIRQTIQLSPGDTLYLYTDGVNEAMNPEEEQFTNERLREGLNKAKNSSIEGIVQSMKLEIKAFVKTASQSDDITMVILKYKGKQ